MKLIGFIDLQGDGGSISETLPVNVFRGNAKGFELVERSAKSLSFSEFYLSLPVRLLNFRILKLPFSDKEKLKKVIPLELENLTMSSTESIVFDVIILGGSGDSFDVLVVYMDKEVLNGILTKLAFLNIDPDVVTSLELRSVLNGGPDDVASRLTNAVELSPEQRMSAASGELKANTINLRTGQFALTKGVEKINRRLRNAAILSILVAIVIHSDLAFRVVTAKKDVSSIRKDIRIIYSGLFPGEKKITDELYQMKAHMRETREKGDALIGIYPLQTLMDLSKVKLHGVVFNEISLDKDKVTIKGEAASMDDIGRMKTEIAKSLKDISVTDIKPSVAGKVLFTVIAKGQV